MLSGMGEGWNQPLNVRLSQDLMDAVDQAANREDMSRSDYVREALQAAIYQSQPRRPTRNLIVQRRRISTGASPLCNHPMRTRSAKAPDGSAQCVSCGATIKEYA